MLFSLFYTDPPPLLSYPSQVVIFEGVSIKVGVLVHEIVVVSNFPFTRSLVVRGEHVENFSPSQICLKTDHILDRFLIVGPEQNVRVILVLHEELHGGLDEAGDRHAEGSPLFGVEGGDPVALLIRTLLIIGGGCAQSIRLSNRVV